MTLQLLIGKTFCFFCNSTHLLIGGTLCFFGNPDTLSFFRLQSRFEFSALTHNLSFGAALYFLSLADSLLCDFSLLFLARAYQHLQLGALLGKRFLCLSSSFLRQTTLFLFALAQFLFATSALLHFQRFLTRFLSNALALRADRAQLRFQLGTLPRTFGIGFLALFFDLQCRFHQRTLPRKLSFNRFARFFGEHALLFFGFATCFFSEAFSFLFFGFTLRLVKLMLFPFQREPFRLFPLPLLLCTTLPFRNTLFDGDAARFFGKAILRGFLFCSLSVLRFATFPFFFFFAASEHFLRSAQLFRALLFRRLGLGSVERACCLTTYANSFGCMLRFRAEAFERVLHALAIRVCIGIVRINSKRLLYMPLSAHKVGNLEELISHLQEFTALTSSFLCLVQFSHGEFIFACNQ